MPPAVLPISVAVIGVLGTLGGIWWRNRHEYRMRLLEIQLKQEEREHVAQADFNKRKRDAAETIIKKWSLELEQWNLRKNFYASITLQNWKADQLTSVADRQKRGLEAWEKNAEKADVNGPDLYYMYFCSDLSNTPNVDEKRAALEGLTYTHWDLNQHFRAYLKRAGEIIHDKNESTDAGVRERMASEVSETLTQAFETAKLLRENCQSHMELLQKACKSIQKEIEAI